MAHIEVRVFDAHARHGGARFGDAAQGVARQGKDGGSDGRTRTSKYTASDLRFTP